MRRCISHRQASLTWKYAQGHMSTMMNAAQKSEAIAAFQTAITAAKGQERLAMILGCSQSRVSRIVNGESDCDAEMAARIHIRLSVPKWTLRPDLFDDPSPKRKPKASRKRAGSRGATA